MIPISTYNLCLHGTGSGKSISPRVGLRKMRSAFASSKWYYRYRSCCDTSLISIRLRPVSCRTPTSRRPSTSLGVALASAAAAKGAHISVRGRPANRWHRLPGALKQPVDPSPAPPEPQEDSEQQRVGVTMARILSSVASHPAGPAQRTPTGPLLLGSPSSPSAPQGQQNGSWVENERLLAMIFGGFPHLPCSHSQDVGDVRSLVRTFSAFILCLKQQQQV